MHYENVSEKELISANDGVTKRAGASQKIIINTQYNRTITTLNTKITNNKEKIQEFNLKAAKTRNFFTSNSKCHLNNKNSR
jgi:hypothetical protein